MHSAILYLVSGLSLQSSHHVSARPSWAGSANPTDYHANAGVLQYVNPNIGTSSISANDNGGMIPSVSVPFGMTRWTPQTRENYISQVPYHDGDAYLHGFQATHQPAIWMGELGQIVLSPGWSKGVVKPLFEQRGKAFRKEDEVSTPYVYEVLLDADTEGEHDWDLTEEAAGEGPVPGGAAGAPGDVRDGANGRVRRRGVAEGNYTRGVRVAMTAAAHTGYLRFDFRGEGVEESGTVDLIEPYVHIQVSRRNWTGQVQIDPQRQEISGSNPQRQDYRLGPDKPASFRGYFVSRFSAPFSSYGTSLGANLSEGNEQASGELLGAYAKFPANQTRVEVRTAISFVSVAQARKNLDIESPDGTSFEDAVERTKAAWLDKLGRVTIEGVNATDADHDPRTIWYTGLFHALQYPSDFSEPTDDPSRARTFYSGYTDSVHTSNDSYYQSWSLWDTYRAEHSLLTLFAPERVNSMMRTLLRIFDWTGRLPMWANLVETNIMIATNADAVLANALSRGFRSFDLQKAWAAARKDAYVPPENDTQLLYYDREPDTPYEARAGLTSYMRHGWVDNDRWAESGSRTLDYAFNDAACAVVARAAGLPAEADALEARSKNYAHLWDSGTGFMRARNANGSFADAARGWTEGDRWAYTFDVLHDAPGGLAALFPRGRRGMREKLDEHFGGGHNVHGNEPSHHIPYLYALIGYPAAAAETVRGVAWENYNATSRGLAGNEDLGQMSAWYVFSALGFYPVNPAGEEYVVGSPFFERVRIRWPEGAATGGEVAAADGCGGGGRGETLVIEARGAAKGKPYVKGLSVDGRVVDRPVLRHADIVGARLIKFEMSDTPTGWGEEGEL